MHGLADVMTRYLGRFIQRRLKVTRYGDWLGIYVQHTRKKGEAIKDQILIRLDL